MWPFTPSDFDMGNMPDISNMAGMGGMGNMGRMGNVGNMGNMPMNMNFSPLMDPGSADHSAGDQFSSPPLFNPNFASMAGADFNGMAHSMNQTMGAPFRPSHPSHPSHSSQPSHYQSDELPTEPTRTSSPSHTAKSQIDLNTRAIELKEKLLRSRMQQPRTGPTSPAVAKNPQNTPGVSAGTGSDTGKAAPDTGKPATANTPPQPQLEAEPVVRPEPQAKAQGKMLATSRAHRPLLAVRKFVPRPTLQQLPQGSISADADDIAALISSISSNTASSREKKAVETAKPEMPKQLATPSEKKNNVDSQTAGKPPPSAPAAGAAMKISTSTARAQSPEEEEEEEGEVTSPSRADESPTVGNKTLAQERLLVPRLPSIETKPKSSKNDVNTGTGRPYSKSYTSAPSPYYRESRPRPVPQDNKPAVRLPPPRSAPGAGSSNGPVAEERTKLARGIRETKDEPKPAADKDKATVAAPQKVVDEWLRMTDFWDVERRNEQLDQFVKMEALEADMRRLEAEKEKIRAQLGYKFNGASASTTTAAAPAITPAAAPAATPATPTAPSAPADKPETKEASAVVPTGPARHSATGPSAPSVLKRKYEDDDQAQRRQDKFSRNGDQADPRAQEGGYRDNRDRERNSRNYEGRAGSPRPYAYSPRHESYRRPSPSRGRAYSPQRQGQWQKPDYRDRGGHEMSRYDSYRGLASRRPSPPRDFRRRGSGPSQLDLGGPGDSRFFIVKSFNEENVTKCMQDGLWTTQIQNGQVLTSAFASCKNVILFFSVNKSKAFQGFARMSTTPSPDTPRPKWMENIHWDTTPPFRIEWISKTTVQFWRIGHLKNALNEGQAVLVGKDGQEVEEGCGHQLVGEMQNVAEIFAHHRNGGGGGSSSNGHGDERPPSFRQRGGGNSGYGRGAGRGQPYMKRESHDRDW